jgi:hypothetical protein
VKRSLRALRSAARRPGVILAAILLVAGTAFAVTRPLLHANEPAASPRATQPAKLDAELDALDTAQATGKPVTVNSLTTELSQTVANPDGTLTSTDYVLPVRVREKGAWQPVSATLRQTASGSWQPQAVPSAVSLSGGGAGPLATLTSVTGQAMSLSFPVTLPAPVVSGATATYDSVWPDTDLQVTVNTLGGLTWTIIAGNATAAANPALRNLNLGISGPDLSVTSDQAGGLSATAPSGSAQFSGPPTTMWDSRTSGSSSPAARAAGAPRKSTATSPGWAARIAMVKGALTGRTLHMTPSTSLLSSTADYPVYVSSSITPDATTAPAGTPSAGTTAAQPPIKLSAYTKTAAADASPSPDCDTVQNENEACSGSGNGFVEVQEGCPTYTNYDVSEGDSSYPGNGIGYNWWDSCIGPYRSYYQFNTSSLIATLTAADATTPTANLWVESSTLYAWVRYGADFNCSDKWPVYLDWSGSINSSTDWNNKPGLNASDQQKSFSTPSGPNPSSSCSEQTIDFDVTYAIAKAVNTSAKSMTFRLDGNETDSSSTSNIGFMRIGNNPDIITVFDLNPPTPTSLKTSPAGAYEPGGPAAYGCGAATTNMPWIGAADTTTTASGKVLQLDLQASISAGITGEPVQAHYQMWDNGTALPADEVTGNDGASQNWFTTSATTNTPINFAPKDGEQYTWNTKAFVSGTPEGSDPGYWSQPSTTCGFNLDMTPPAAPTVSSSAFPKSGSPNEPYAGTSGTFAFSSSDPTPANCSECLTSGVYEFAYSLNNEDALTSLADTTQVGCSSTTETSTSGVIQASSGAATSCPVTPTLWGTNILYVAAVDKAGNSTVTAYYFYVPWDPNKHPVPGDVNGDSIPDLLATGTGSNGDLTLYKGDNDLTISTSQASPQADSPDGSSWSNYQIAHRGPVSQVSASGDVDDLYAHKNGGSALYLYKNNPSAPGTGAQFGDTSAIVPVPRPTCTGSNCSGYASTWSDVTQMLSPGDAWNPTATTDASTDAGEPSLLTVEDVNGTYELWAFQGDYAPALAGPVELGSSGWSNITLAAPGYINGRLTIWAYDRTTGNVYSYPIYVVNGLPSLSSTSNSPIQAEQESASFTYPYPQAGTMVASPGALDMYTTPGGTSLGETDLPGLFLATPPHSTSTPTELYVDSAGTMVPDIAGNPNPNGVMVAGSDYDPNEVTSTPCANGCLWYYPGQETNGTYSLSTAPQFVGDLPAPIGSLS